MSQEIGMSGEACGEAFQSELRHQDPIIPYAAPIVATQEELLVPLSRAIVLKQGIVEAWRHLCEMAGT